MLQSSPAIAANRQPIAILLVAAFGLGLGYGTTAAEPIPLPRPCPAIAGTLVNHSSKL